MTEFNNRVKIPIKEYQRLQAIQNAARVAVDLYEIKPLPDGALHFHMTPETIEALKVLRDILNQEGA